jgi:hypothetical protein
MFILRPTLVLVISCGISLFWGFESQAANSLLYCQNSELQFPTLHFGDSASGRANRSLDRRQDSQDANNPPQNSQADEDSASDKAPENADAANKESEEQSPPAKNSDDKKTDPPKKEEEKKEWYQKLNVRGYAQVRYNYLTHRADGSALQQHAGDNAIDDRRQFSIRRARVIFYGDMGDHLYLYMQPDFASTPENSGETIQFAQIRDWYGDVYLDKEKVNRFRIGQSKIPYGWENMQSSQNRLYLDRNDAFNSAARNERDLGVFYYWTPNWAQDIFKFISDEGLKGSGNYGIFGVGAYDGQGGSLRERNGELHLISRLTWPWFDQCGQLHEIGIQAYTGRYVVTGSPISPLGVGPAIQPIGTGGRLGDAGQLDQRLGWTYVRYPQPLGFQAEYTIGRGPELNAAQTELERGFLHGGYWMLNYRFQTSSFGEIWPFIRYQYYRGGYKSSANAPLARINEWNIGWEWQIKKDFELVTEYLITDRTNLTSRNSGLSYGQFDGHVLRFQFQFNF